jgi:hypothetical protein
MSVFENEHGLRQIGDWSFFRRSRGSWLCFLSISTWLRREDVCIWTRCRRPGAAAIENCGTTTVIFRILRLITRLVCHTVADIEFPNHRIGVRDVNRAAAWEELAALMLMMVAAIHRRVRIRRKLGNAAGLVKIWSSRLHTNRSQRSDTRRHTLRGVDVSAKIG